MIYIGSDHGGYELKEKVKKWLIEAGHEIQDVGPDHIDPEDDYPVYAFQVAEAVGSTDNPEKPWKDRNKGILICRSSVGVVIAANKVIGVRAASLYDETVAKHSRTNDDVNVMGLSGDWMTDDAKAQLIIKTWLTTEFTHETRHQRRIDEISEYEQSSCGGCCGGGGCGDGGCSCEGK